jgi:hypothetical protein
MLYTTPPITPNIRKRLAELDQLRTALGRQVGEAGPWLGALRLMAKASSVESSTSIEGFHVPAAEAVAIVSGESPRPEDENRMALPATRARLTTLE